jgi:peptidoglycan/LPS O-acetylase OafA/YrhL
MALLRLHKKPRWFGLACLIVALNAGVWLYASQPGLTVRGLVPGHVLVLSFLGGVAIYLNKEIVPFSPTILGVAGIMFIYCVVEPRWVYFSAIPAAYVTAYIGCLDFPRHRLIYKFDVSYGLFLYGYPVQQMVVAWFDGALSWYANVLLALPITFVVAYFSLIVVERPAHRWLTNMSAPPWSVLRGRKTKQPGRLG